MKLSMSLAAARCALALMFAALTLAGCETTTSLGKKIDYKSVQTAPALEIPPDLNVAAATTTATTCRPRRASPRATRRSPRRASRSRPTRSRDAKIVQGGQRALAASSRRRRSRRGTSRRKFWLDNGFVLAIEHPSSGLMETDWAENRADLPHRFPAQHPRQVRGSFLYDLQARQVPHAHRARQRARAPSRSTSRSRGMEQVPTAKIDNSSPAAFAWAVLPPNPGLDAEWLTRLMMRFGVPETQANDAAQASTTAASTPDRAQLREGGRRRQPARASTTASTAPGAASVSRSTASVSPSSIATARRACISSATRTRRRRRAARAS